jgi:hypothetical protein
LLAVLELVEISAVVVVLAVIAQATHFLLEHRLR